MPETTKETQLFRFDQMAVQVKDKVEPEEADVDRYVGLEHIDPESLKIRRWGEPSDVESSKILFRSGDIIFGKRRAYQRKLAVADFDGICSAHAMVLRPKTDVVLEEFLPFFMQSDIFMDRAVKISVGGLSPTINWRDLAKEKFALPPLKEQQKLCTALHACQTAIDKLTELRTATNSLFASSARQFFTGSVGHKHFKPGPFGVIPQSWTVLKVKDLFEETVISTPDCDRYPLHSLSIEHGIIPKTDRYKRDYLIKDKLADSYKAVLPGQIAINPMNLRWGGIAHNSTDSAVSVSKYYDVIKPLNEQVDSEFWFMLFKSPLMLRQYERVATGTLSEKKRVHLRVFLELSVPRPSETEQIKFISQQKSIIEKTTAIDRRITQLRYLASLMVGLARNETESQNRPAR